MAAARVRDHVDIDVDLNLNVNSTLDVVIDPSSGRLRRGSTSLLVTGWPSPIDVNVNGGVQVQVQVDVSVCPE
jgi:hypothetical protein